MNKTQSTIAATSRKKCKLKTASWLVILVVLSLLNDDAHNHVSAFTTPSSSLLLSGLASSSLKCRYSCYTCRSFAYIVGHDQEEQEDRGGGGGGGGGVLFHHHGATTTSSRRDFAKHATDIGKILSTLVLSTATAATTATTNASTAYAAGVDSPAAAEIIRQSAAKIPGYGQPDVYYPPFFLGRWRVTRVIVSLSTEYDNPLLLSSASSSSSSSSSSFSSRLSSSLTVPFALTYDVRFIPVGNDGGSDTTKVIADRAFNTASFYQALRFKLQQQQQQQEETNILKEKEIHDKMVGIPPPSPIPLPSIQRVDWSSSNPNTCTIYYSDGSWKEIRVTKRASEWNIEEGGGLATVFSSEYQRVCTTGGTSSRTANSIPVIEAVRVMTKWKSQGWEKDMGKEGEGQDKDVEENKRNQVVVEGIEVVYLDDAARNGGMGGTGSGGTNVVMKSRLKLERIL